MPLYIVNQNFIDRAWNDGASCLAEATDLVDEITGDQLKLILSRGERILLRMDKEGKTVGWATYRVDQYPNIRVLHLCDLVAHNASFELFFDELKTIAEQLGCSRIRCSCHPAQARLYRMKLNFKPVYETLEVKI